MKQFTAKFISWISILLLIKAIPGERQARTKCYGDLGCFPNGYPWTSPIRRVPPPHNPKTVGTKIYCYTRESKQRYNITLRPNISLNGCQFKVSRQSVFMVHGYSSNGNATWLNTMKDYYLEKVDANAFIVDWGPGSEIRNYLQAVSNTRIVGAEVARFLRYLIRVFGLAPRQVYLIGFSLGAHTVSYTSNNLSSNVGRITGLDPAQPAFEGTNRIVRLDQSDAKFVDVHHTSAAPSVPCSGFGYMEPAGHVDFYYNKGNKQPGCFQRSTPSPTTSIRDFANNSIAQSLVNSASCSHSRAYLYFISALRSNCTFVGHKTTFRGTKVVKSCFSFSPIALRKHPNRACNPVTCTFVGLDTPSYPARGVFVVYTTGSPPYCRKK